MTALEIIAGQIKSRKIHLEALDEEIAEYRAKVSAAEERAEAVKSEIKSLEIAQNVLMHEGALGVRVA